ALFIFMLFINFVGSQNEFKLEFLVSESKEPVSFATIKFGDTYKGVVADYNGQVRIPYKIIEGIDSLFVSAIGFKTLALPVNSLQMDSLNTSLMQPKVEALETIVLTAKRKRRKYPLANEIVRNAVKRIRFNLDENPHSYIGYYRDYQILDDGEYYNLNEAIIEQFDKGIKSHKILDSKNREAVHYYARNFSFRRNSVMASAYDNKNKSLETTSVINYGGNELVMLNVHDPIRNYQIDAFSFIYRMSFEFIKNHRFEKKAVTYKNNEQLIKILFTSIKDKTSDIYSAEGSITISLKDYAIHQFTYSLFDWNKKDPITQIRIDYQKKNNLMYPSYTSFNNRFIFKGASLFKVDAITFNREEHSFDIQFNKALDFSSLKMRKFNIKFRNRDIKIKELIIVDKYNIKLEVDFEEYEFREITEDDLDDLDVGIKNIRDQQGRLIFKNSKEVAYQYREFFVQEVFEQKDIDLGLRYLNKLKPLYSAPVNEKIDIDDYIINTPLMNRRIENINE
ncbi:MAG: hypothetical protein AAGH46_08460, partial [Bacteroidota bacterium]